MINVSVFIAKRYLFAKKSYNLINVISFISFVGVFVCAASLIIVLSVFNGFENLQVKLFNAFDPDLKITLKEGKFFTNDTRLIEKINKNKNIGFITPVIEESALVKYKDKQYIVTIKGVDSTFLKWSKLTNYLLEGMPSPTFKNNESNLIVGNTIAAQLDLVISDVLNPISIYTAKPGRKIEINPEDNFNKLNTFALNIFTIQPEIDGKFMLCDIATVQALLNKKKLVSALEIHLNNSDNLNETKQFIKNALGNAYDVKTRYEQHELLYKIMKSEKWIIFFILFFILLMASFNIVGSLTMLILDKKKDIKILQNIGADNSLIKKIFITEGLLISIGGALGGLFVGSVFCIIQQQYGLIKLGAANDFIVQYYPVKLMLLDFIYVFVAIVAIGYIAAAWPVKIILRNLTQ